MLPNAAEQDEVEGKAEPVRGGQRGQAVVEPTQAGVGVAALALGPHRRRGLDPDDVVSEAGQPSRVAAGAGSDVQHQARFWRQQVEQPCMQPGRIKRLVSRGELGRTSVIPADGER